MIGSVVSSLPNGRKYTLMMCIRFMHGNLGEPGTSRAPSFDREAYDTLIKRLAHDVKFMIISLSNSV